MASPFFFLSLFSIFALFSFTHSSLLIHLTHSLSTVTNATAHGLLKATAARSQSRFRHHHRQVSLHHYLLPLDPPLRLFSAMAFTSRAGIAAFAEALAAIDLLPLNPPDGHTFTIAALGKDAELLEESFILKLCQDPAKIRVLVPAVATPSGLVEALGAGEGFKVLCPVPVVIGLEEPSVVGRFLADLRRKGWIGVRVEANETRWWRSGAAKVVERMKEGGGVDAIVFMSTAEVEGLLKGLGEVGMDWG